MRLLARGPAICLIVAACVLVVGCDSGSSSGPGGLRAPAPNGSGGGSTLLGASPAPGQSFVQATAALSHTPVGTGSLTWSSSDNIVHVDISMTGVAPTSAYVAFVANGPCANPNGQAFSIGTLTPDQNGRVNMHQDIANQTNGFPLNGSMFVQKQGGGRPPLSVACGDLGNSVTGVAGSNASATTTLGATTDSNQNVSGKAYLRQIGATLLVHVDAYGLDPNSSHSEAIYQGDCTYLSYRQYGLPTLNADGNGYASSDITINNSQPMPTRGWYVAIKYGTDPSTVFDQNVACGNVRVLLGGQ